MAPVVLAAVLLGACGPPSQALLREALVDACVGWFAPIDELDWSANELALFVVFALLAAICALIALPQYGAFRRESDVRGNATKTTSEAQRAAVGAGGDRARQPAALLLDGGTKLDQVLDQFRDFHSIASLGIAGRVAPKSRAVAIFLALLRTDAKG
ncbi:MAG: hypothetical protein ACR2H9_15765 [Longimicrobiaceae bacterium]|nr:hypothetical protein [Gemmatimonadota bacterium]